MLCDLVTCRVRRNKPTLWTIATAIPTQGTCTARNDACMKRSCRRDGKYRNNRWDLSSSSKLDSNPNPFKPIKTASRKTPSPKP